MSQAPGSRRRHPRGNAGDLVITIGKEVTVAIFKARPDEDPPGQDLGADVAKYLARHDVSLSVAPFNDIDNVGEVLL